MVDGVFSAVGSTNFDSRSLRLNDEANLNLLGPSFGQEQRRVFEADRALGKSGTHAQWLARPWTDKIRERLASILHSQL